MSFYSREAGGDGVYLVCVINSCQGIRHVLGEMRGSPSGGGFCSHGFPAWFVRHAWKQDKNRNAGEDWKPPMFERRENPTGGRLLHYVMKKLLVNK